MSAGTYGYAPLGHNIKPGRRRWLLYFGCIAGAVIGLLLVFTFISNDMGKILDYTGLSEDDFYSFRTDADKEAVADSVDVVGLGDKDQQYGDSQESVEGIPAVDDVDTPFDEELPVDMSDSQDTETETDTDSVLQEIPEELPVAPPPKGITDDTIFSSYLDHLEPSTKYFTYIVDAGGTSNQFRTFLNGINLGSKLNRTIIVPPIMPTVHVKGWSGPRYSTFYDLELFTEKTGIKLVEWYDIKSDPPAMVPKEYQSGPKWQRLSEPMDCYRTNSRTFRQPYPFHRQFFMDPLVKTEDEQDYRGMQISPVDKSFGKAKKTVDHVETFSQPFHAEQDFLCITDAYEMIQRGKVAWDGLGPNLRFSKALDDAVDVLVDELIPAEKRLDPTRSVGDDFVVFHIRRNDVAMKCKQSIGLAPKKTASKEYAAWNEKFLKSRCFVSTESAFHALRDWVKVDPTNRAGIPVIVATDEKRPAKLEEFSNPKQEYIETVLPDGSIKTHYVTLVNHIELDTAHRFLTDSSDSPAIGGYWVPMIDANLLTRGRYLIGSQPSTMSSMAIKRRMAWREGTDKESVMVPRKWSVKRHLRRSKGHTKRHSSR